MSAEHYDPRVENNIAMGIAKTAMTSSTMLISETVDGNPQPWDLKGDDELRWREHALCAQTDPEAFFPEKGGSTREAKRICVTCPVRNECLEHALESGERFGIWGGLSERERRRLTRRVR